MTPAPLSEDHWEHLALERLGDDWRPLHGTAIVPGTGERETWDDLVIPSRLRAALRALNPDVPREYLDQAFLGQVVQCVTHRRLT